MPELPDLTVYLWALQSRLVGRRLQRVVLFNALLLRTVTPPLVAVEQQRGLQLRRIGKRIAIGLQQQLWLVLRLMIAGRLHWTERGGRLPRAPRARFEFEHGTLTLTAAGSGFPERVTAFRSGMAAHGRFGEPRPQCGTALQRIRYAENEPNYCPRCQTQGRMLADRALSRLLKRDWPRTIDAPERGAEPRAARACRQPLLHSRAAGGSNEDAA